MLHNGKKSENFAFRQSVEPGTKTVEISASDLKLRDSDTPLPDWSNIVHLDISCLTVKDKQHVRLEREYAGPILQKLTWE